MKKTILGILICVVAGSFIGGLLGSISKHVFSELTYALLTGVAIAFSWLLKYTKSNLLNDDSLLFNSSIFITIFVVFIIVL